MLRLFIVIALAGGAAVGMKLDRALAPGRCERAGGAYDARGFCIEVPK